MKSKKIVNLTIDKFIDFSLYDKKLGYYMKKNPFGTKGDFITAPNISRLFPEMLAIWIISFWKSLGAPKKLNLIELGAGNGEMMEIIIESLKNFPNFFSSCNLVIHEKSPTLIKIQKKKLCKNKINWISNLKELKRYPSIFIANEFFDSLSIKQFIKKKGTWFERYVHLEKSNNSFFIDKRFDIKKYEKKLKLNISQNQNFIEFSETGLKYLRNISSMIKKNSGGLLIFDYGYLEKKMKNTLQAINNHKFSNILEDIGNSDITHNINFHMLKKIVNQISDLDCDITIQRDFLLRMGIKERAEIISRNKSFLEKTDIYYRLNRLINKSQMGSLFKVMLIKNKKNKHKLGF